MKKVRTKGVFEQLLPTMGKRAEWEAFVYETKQAATDNSFILDLIKQYSALVEESYFQKKMLEAARIEIRILQHICAEDPQIILSPVKQFRGGEQIEYIVARSPFIEIYKARQELRIYLGRVDEYGKTISQLSEDSHFMHKAKEKMKTEMNKIIAETEKFFKMSGG
jgi:hypothetical protein